MNVPAANAFLRSCARNGLDTSMYPDIAVENAIQGIGNDFCMRVHPNRTSNLVNLTAGTAYYSFSVANFRPEYLNRAVLIGLTSTNTEGFNPALEVTEWTKVFDLVTNNPIQGQPRLIGFDTYGSFYVWPIPDAQTAAAGVQLYWEPPFTAWTSGSGSMATLNLPDEYLQSILRWGGVYFLQGNEPENQKAMATCWANYLDFVKRCQSNGAGTLGKMVEHRCPRRGAPGRVIFDSLYH